MMAFRVVDLQLHERLRIAVYNSVIAVYTCRPGRDIRYYVLRPVNVKLSVDIPDSVDYSLFIYNCISFPVHTMSDNA